MSGIVPSGQGKIVVRDNWDFNHSVELVKPILGRWKSEAKEMIIPELWNAHEHAQEKRESNLLQHRKENTFPSIEWTFADYCEAIGITRQTGRNWLIEAGVLLSGAHVSNNTGNQENYTPPVVIEAVRDVLGEIDLDPTSCELANEVVGASKIYTEEDNALEQEWSGRVFMNPPYQQPEIRLFAEKLIEQLPHIQEAIVLVNNNTDTRWFHALALHSTAICFTSGRIGFYTPDNPKTAPTNGQAFFYFGDRIEMFRKRFSEIGLIVKVCQDGV